MGWGASLAVVKGEGSFASGSDGGGGGASGHSLAVVTGGGGTVAHSLAVVTGGSFAHSP